MPNVMQNLFNYSSRRTIIHNINPSIKMIGILCLEFIAFFLVGLQYSIPVLLATIVLLFVAKIPSSTVKAFLAGILWMMVIAQLSFALVSPPMGDHLAFSIGQKDVYYENIMAGLSISIRIGIMTMLSAVLVGTTSQREMVTGLRGLGVPYSIAFILGLTFRTIITLASDWDIIRQAQSSRCLDVDKGNLITKMKKRVSVGLPLTSALVNKMDQINVALECRAVGSDQKPIEYFDKKSKWWEALLMISMLILTITIISLQIFFKTFQ